MKFEDSYLDNPDEDELEEGLPAMLSAQLMQAGDEETTTSSTDEEEDTDSDY